jgi:hypothetical protein
MSNCKISVVLAYSMAVYCLACIYYIIATRSVGTPFNDSLTPKQREIKEASAKVRRNAFYTGAGIAVVILLFARPFEKC